MSLCCFAWSTLSFFLFFFDVFDCEWWCGGLDCPDSAFFFLAWMLSKYYEYNIFLSSFLFWALFPLSSEWADQWRRWFIHSFLSYYWIAKEANKFTLFCSIFLVYLYLNFCSSFDSSFIHFSLQSTSVVIHVPFIFSEHQTRAERPTTLITYLRWIGVCVCVWVSEHTELKDWYRFIRSSFYFLNEQGQANL